MPTVTLSHSASSLVKIRLQSILLVTNVLFFDRKPCAFNTTLADKVEKQRSAVVYFVVIMHHVDYFSHSGFSTLY